MFLNAKFTYLHQSVVVSRCDILVRTSSRDTDGPDSMPTLLYLLSNSHLAFTIAMVTIVEY